MSDPTFPVVPVQLRRTDGPPHVCDLPEAPQAFAKARFVMCTRPTCRRVFELRQYTEHTPSPSGGFGERLTYRWEEVGPLRSMWLRWLHNRATSVGAAW